MSSRRDKKLIAKETGPAYQVTPAEDLPGGPPTFVVKVDSKGRLMIPQEVRTELGIRPGDVFFVQSKGPVLQYAKSENPFEALARYALAEDAEGHTISLEEWEKREGVKPDADE